MGASRQGIATNLRGLREEIVSFGVLNKAIAVAESQSRDSVSGTVDLVTLSLTALSRDVVFANQISPLAAWGGIIRKGRATWLCDQNRTSHPS
jgi:hypothetical protein